MSPICNLPMLLAALPAIASLTEITGMEAQAAEAVGQSVFDEHPIDFRSQDITLAGSLLVPRSGSPLPAVVFVHGAGHHTRNSLREVAEHFASQGIAALIYDKRGVGRSEGVYESHRPYTNLVEDALSAVNFLKERDEIAGSQIGIWGLSQGAYISAAAASRTDDIKFIVAAGASVADGTLFYYRDNLFRLYGLSDTLRDVAEKASLAKYSLPHNLPDGFGLASFLPRRYPTPNKYVHPEWSRVQQPILVMWGQLDQNQPVGESIMGMKNSLALAKNDKWTMFVVPKANHDLGISETGALQSKWLGYAPGVLNTMTEWVHQAVDAPTQLATKKQEGAAQAKGIVSKLARYEGLRWYGNGPVQAGHFILFSIVFLTNAVAGAWACLPRLFRGQTNAEVEVPNGIMNFKRALCAFNFLILAAFTLTIFLVIDQLRPGCPTILLYLPLLGTVSALATLVLLALLCRARRDEDRMLVKRIWGQLEVLCLILFVPFMLYWNLVGYKF